MLKSKLTKDELIKYPLPSAGRIVRGVSPQPDWSKIPKHILDNATDRGTWVHEAIEDYISTGEYQSRWEWQIYMDAFHMFDNLYSPEYLATEYCVVAKQEDSKGIIDVICRIDGQLYILDFKTSSQPHHPTWEMTLNVYHRLIAQDFDEPIKIGVIHLKKSGEFEMYEYDVKPSLTESMIELYQYLRDKKLIKKKGKGDK